MSWTQLSGDQRRHQSCQEDIRDIGDVDRGVLLSLAHAGLPAAHRGPGQPQGEAQGEIQDQEKQQQRGPPGEAEGRISESSILLDKLSSYLIVLNI